MVFGYIFVGVCIAIYAVSFVEAHGWPWLKRFNERREKTSFWSAFLTMDYDDHKFSEWLSRKDR